MRCSSRRTAQAAPPTQPGASRHPAMGISSRHSRAQSKTYARVSVHVALQAVPATSHSPRAYKGASKIGPRQTGSASLAGSTTCPPHVQPLRPKSATIAREIRRIGACPTHQKLPTRPAKKLSQQYLRRTRRYPRHMRGEVSGYLSPDRVQSASVLPSGLSVTITCRSPRSTPARALCRGRLQPLERPCAKRRLRPPTALQPSTARATTPAAA